MDGTALIYCEGALGTARGRIANNLLRFSRRYQIVGVVDSRHAGRTAQEVVGPLAAPAPVFASLQAACDALPEPPRFLVVGIALDEQANLPTGFRATIKDAIRLGLSVDSAHRPFLHDDGEFPQLAMIGPSRLRSVGYPKRMAAWQRYTGALESVAPPRVTVISTAAPVGAKNLTVWLLAEELERRGVTAEIVGTTETAWFQGVKHCALLDTVPSGHVAGELEAAVVQAANEPQTQILLVEGGGSPFHRAHPTAMELLTTARPAAVILQHTPGHPDFPAHDPQGIELALYHLRALTVLTKNAPVAIALNRLDESEDFCAETKAALEQASGAPVYDLRPTEIGPLVAWLEENSGLTTPTNYFPPPLPAAWSASGPVFI